MSDDCIFSKCTQIALIIFSCNAMKSMKISKLLSLVLLFLFLSILNAVAYANTKSETGYDDASSAKSDAKLDDAELNGINDIDFVENILATEEHNKQQWKPNLRVTHHDEIPGSSLGWIHSGIASSWKGHLSERKDNRKGESFFRQSDRIVVETIQRELSSKSNKNGKTKKRVSVVMHLHVSNILVLICNLPKHHHLTTSYKYHEPKL